MPQRTITALAIAGLLVSGCANIGTINGIPVDQMRSTVPVSASSSGARPGFCARNTFLCVVVGLAIIGGIGYLVYEANGGDDKRDEVIADARVNAANAAMDAAPGIAANVSAGVSSGVTSALNAGINSTLGTTGTSGLAF